MESLMTQIGQAENVDTLFITYAVIMIIGFAIILWLLFKQDRSKSERKLEQNKHLIDHDKNTKETEYRLKESITKINSLYNEIATIRKENQDLKVRYKDLENAANAGASSPSESKSNEETEKAKVQLQTQLKETEERLKKAISELQQLKIQNVQCQENCKMLERSLRQKEGVDEKNLPRAAAQ